MKTKNAITSCILNIIQNNTIYEQSELQKMLKEFGHQVAQATLSRKLRHLKIAKINGIYTLFGEKSHSQLNINAMHVVESCSMIIVHTSPGNASNVANLIDKNYVHNAVKSNILGTIAGDDTVLILTRTIKDAEALSKILYKHSSTITL